MHLRLVYIEFILFVSAQKDETYKINEWMSVKHLSKEVSRSARGTAHSKLLKGENSRLCLIKNLLIDKLKNETSVIFLNL